MKKMLTSCLCFCISLCFIVQQCEAKQKTKTSSSKSATIATFSKLSSAKHIFGPEVTPEDLKGKLVFLEYWGINCPPCIASFPHLVELQEKYGKTGKFIILASHSQSPSPRVKTFLTKSKVNFPVYQFFRESAAPCPGGIPYAALIDHTGKVVAKGHPAHLYSKVKDLVEAVPHPILGGVEVKYCKTQAKVLESGKPLANTLKSLEKISAIDGDKGEEAKKLIEAANKYIAAKKNRLIEKAAQQPSKVLDELIIFSKVVNGMDYNSDIKLKIAELKKDSSLKKFIKLRTQIDKLNEKLARKESSSIRKSLEKVKVAVRKLIDSEKTSPGVLNEAKNLLSI